MKALVLSGGGSKGAFQAGVLRELLWNEHNQYDIICGVSVGALNGSLLATFPQGEEEKAFLKLRGIWDSISTKKVYKHWMPFSYIQALFKPSVYNSKPLHDLVKKMVTPEKIRKTGKKLMVGAVSLDTGEYNTFTEQDDDIVEGILASSSFPAMLLPVKAREQLWTDGGVRNVTPLKEAIDAGATHIDIVLTSPKNKPLLKKKKYRTLEVAHRSLEFMMDELITNDLKSVETINRVAYELQGAGINSKYRQISTRLFRPDTPLTKNSLNFSQENIQHMYKQGLLIGARDAK